ncbi:arginase family protein [Xanthomonas citri pv. anacardii]|uniref:arginase family protein n=1 Tax=Xanthomonas citri TaxID=346 RepID=UPI000CCC6B86|nr:arginase family protein [Xanthomonas citri]MCT8358601.1 arginase family protein [Xanthomonas citri pv. anacardii]MCT8362646.1 arginase family protein [Xanthomonas citri pv. anacardii]MCT8366676.1 arginase family protein [Xanthomonas citri pv. anacardii]MCT8370705.1 arginase family protein [Xanthomonas citri pv. anacardii]MCT8374726.1 arginase family protein [Xanthomonas citri pv. anacardii]
MSDQINGTLKLLFPQWQGGDNPPYHFGAQLLNWLSPAHSGAFEEVPVQQPTAEALPIVDQIVAKTELVRQAHAAREIIHRHQPDRLIVLGGDCLVDLAPFAYLSEKYGSELGILWVDTHPDITLPGEWRNAHAMVLANLLGLGDPDFTSLVSAPLKPSQIMFAGLHDTLPHETSRISKLGIRAASPADLRDSSAPVLDWIQQAKPKYLAIHLDLDVLDPAGFRSLLFANPDAAPDAFEGVAQGHMAMQAVTRLLSEVAEHVEVVGIGIAEHLPWDALALKNMLAQLPLIGNQQV